jgi:hypothetical protein
LIDVGRIEARHVAAFIQGKNEFMQNPMKRYVIERNIPGVVTMTGEELKAAAVTSCDALAKLYGKAQWEHSYVTGDKTFCVYLADSEATIREHAKLSGFPANTITEVRSVIDPMTAFV